MNLDIDRLATGPLAQSWAKFGQANEHFTALIAELTNHNHGLNPIFDFGSRINRAESKLELVVVKVGTPPVRWSLLVGDFVQNLRASLDYLVAALARANGVAPNRNHQFPVFSSRPPQRPGNGETDRWFRRLHGLHPAALDFIDRLQPYAMPVKGKHVLSGLNNLSNADKHRFILPAAMALKPPTGDGYWLDVESKEDVGEIGVCNIRTGYAMADGDVFADADIQVTGPNPDITVKGSLGVDWGFGDERVPVMALRQMIQVVLEILGAAEKHHLGFTRPSGPPQGSTVSLHGRPNTKPVPRS